MAQERAELDSRPTARKMLVYRVDSAFQIADQHYVYTFYGAGRLVLGCYSFCNSASPTCATVQCSLTLEVLESGLGANA